MTATNVDDTDFVPFKTRMTKACVTAAVIFACCLAVFLAKQQAPEGEFYIWAGGFIVVALLEFTCWHGVGTSAIEGRKFVFAVYLILGVICSGGTWITNFFYSAVATNERASHQLQSFNTTTDLNRDEEELTAKRRRLEETVSKAPARTADAADAAIKNAMADKFWVRTAGCTEKKGAQTKAFCDAYAAAVADKSNASAAVQARADLANTETALASVREKRATTKGETSREDPTVAAIMSRTGADADTARVYKAMILPTIIQAILILGGLLWAVEDARYLKAAPWFPSLSLWFRSSVYRAATGKRMKPPVSAAEAYEQAAATPLKPAEAKAGPERVAVIGIKQPSLLEEWKQKNEGNAAS